MRAKIAQVGVVVPAHNEEHLLHDCLLALQTAARTVRLPVTILVVLDACIDGSLGICQRFGVETAEIEARNVGTARALGFQTLIGRVPDPQRLWLASTDADSQVGSTWLCHQLDLADADADVALGPMRLSVGSAAPELRQAFEMEYRKQILEDGSHNHVHGANLGIRASVYLKAGGFPQMSNHEDRWLLQRLRRTPGVIIERSHQLIVSTSGRLEGRCDHGFAVALAALAPSGAA